MQDNLVTDALCLKHGSFSDSLLLRWCLQKTLVDGRMIVTAASIMPADSREPLSIFSEQGMSPSSLAQVCVPCRALPTLPNGNLCHFHALMKLSCGIRHESFRLLSKPPRTC